MKLREEIHSVFGSNYRLLKESDVPKLPFLQAVVKETLRFNPIATLRPRQCDVDTRINGYDIEAGTRILINAYAIMRDSDSWEKPDDFFPERFLADSTDTNSDHHRPAMDFKAGDHDFHFLPFGSGRRACVAASHGLIVTHATIGALVQCFDWEVKDDAKIDNELATASISLVQTISAKIGAGKAGLPPSPRALPINGHMHLLGPNPHQAFHKLSTRYGPCINYGPHWKFMKKLCTTELLGSRTLDQFLPIRCEGRNRFLKLVLKKAEAKEAVDVGGELMRLTNNIISRMLLRTRCSDNENGADEGFEKRLKDARDRYDAMMERIMKEQGKR
ncbi:hypothetical protein POTOM_051446 [Populus tomentosa]|uniref:Uncharacterized protein n=1 Tax=Populus tomentosa TaxID=118781 RepID=A0A8X7Y5K9_POPTO|nr:hypothetical protein POTOM_051446 [Populus tomentosa]